MPVINNGKSCYGYAQYVYKLTCKYPITRTGSNVEGTRNNNAGCAVWYTSDTIVAPNKP